MNFLKPSTIENNTAIPIQNSSPQDDSIPLLRVVGVLCIYLLAPVFILLHFISALILLSRKQWLMGVSKLLFSSFGIAILLLFFYSPAGEYLLNLLP